MTQTEPIHSWRKALVHAKDNCQCSLTLLFYIHSFFITSVLLGLEYLCNPAYITISPFPPPPRHHPTSQRLHGDMNPNWVQSITGRWECRSGSMSWQAQTLIWSCINPHYGRSAAAPYEHIRTIWGAPRTAQASQMAFTSHSSPANRQSGIQEMTGLNPGWRFWCIIHS